MRVRPRRVEHAVPVGPLVRVPPEVIPLGLRQVRGQGCPPVRIEVIQRPRQRRRRDAVPDRHDHDPPPRRGSVVYLRGDDRIEEQIRQLRVAVQRILDLLQKRRADDAPPLPQPGAFAEVDTPIHVVARALDDSETLGVRAHLSGVECRFQVVEELPPVHGYLGTGHLGSAEDGRRPHALVLARADVARVEGRGHGGSRDAPLGRLLDRPASGSLHACAIYYEAMMMLMMMMT